MDLGNGIDLVIRKSYYNKTKVQEDGVTQVVDTDTQHPLYQLQVSKSYFDTDSESEVVDKIIDDLQSSIEILRKIREKEEKSR